MEAQARAHNDEEEREADAQSDGDVPVVGEWENLDEAPADGDADSSDDLAASLQPIITIVTVRWGPRCKTWTKDALWDLYAKLGVSTQVGKTVGKRVLFDVLRAIVHKRTRSMTMSLPMQWRRAVRSQSIQVQGGNFLLEWKLNCPLGLTTVVLRRGTMRRRTRTMLLVNQR